ncbi:MAG: hypothetical protein K0S47_3036 [Herbinix sp.]|nr:hypothetical protein [Herbinix sp.]
MKKAIIGSTFLLSGILVSMSILITGVILEPTVGSWNGSRLLTTISVKELSVPFAIGIILSIIGLLILIIELCNKKDRTA